MERLVLQALGKPCSPPISAAPHFLFQGKLECRFANGSAGQVRYLERHIYDRQEVLRFDSRRGWYEAVTELGERQARDFNSQKVWMEYLRAQVDAFCRYNYQVLEDFFTRTVEPLVKISPTKGDPLAHHTLLICTAAGYYPPGIDIKWLKNGQEQTQGVGYDDEIQNADWTFQYQVMLETVPQRGDVYACQVEHKSVKEPISVQWEPQTSDSAKSKVWTGAVGAVLGLVFVAVGLYLYLKSRKATPLPPPTAKAEQRKEEGEELHLQLPDRINNEDMKGNTRDKGRHKRKKDRHLAANRDGSKCNIYFPKHNAMK
ncbi:H-2 class II histocompatibility antigen, E-S beta chain-like, partial [Heteronotia binoei]|uniref:H-2 class II histocompatibility antigen, E-S beta chain-like n=1 Tax=Heteronotia binoei TaxID=13085 RepID=UPI00292EE934